MKHLIYIALCIMAIAGTLTSCKTGTFASEGGKDDMAYLQIFSSDEYAGKTVTVILDNNTKFDVKVRKAKQSTEKHNYELYGIKPGNRHIRIILGDKTIYEKQIFTTSQQTKTIIL